MRYLPQPPREQIELPAVLEALSDPTRLGIVLELAAHKGEAEARCNEFLHISSKTNLTYHFAKLRAAGVTRARAEGAARLISLRRDDLEARFPGLLDTVIRAARARPRRGGKRRIGPQVRTAAG
jgi:DNA-binding transcriptional ArsR family regulator